MVYPRFARACEHSDLIKAVELVSELTDSHLGWEHLVIFRVWVVFVQEEKLLTILGCSLSDKAVDEESVLLGF